MEQNTAMNCENVSELLDAYSADALGGPARLAVQAHLGACAACGAELARIRRTVALLRSVTIPPPPADLAARLVHMAARHAHTRARQRRVLRIAAFAATAVLAVGVMIGVARWSQDADPAQGLAEVVLTAGVVSTVALEFDSRRPLQDVLFTVNLPEGFELAGHEGKRRVAWSGALEPGRNRLNLRLKSIAGADGVLVARISREGRSRTFQLQLKAAGENSGSVRPQGELEDALSDPPIPTHSRGAI